MTLFRVPAPPENIQPAPRGYLATPRRDLPRTGPRNRPNCACMRLFSHCLFAPAHAHVCLQPSSPVPAAGSRPRAWVRVCCARATITKIRYVVVLVVLARIRRGGFAPCICERVHVCYHAPACASTGVQGLISNKRLSFPHALRLCACTQDRQKP